jgi:hypothetical protein
MEVPCIADLDNTGVSHSYDLIGYWRAVLSRTHISHKRNVINCSSVPENPFHATKSLESTKKMKENYVKYQLCASVDIHY